MNENPPQKNKHGNIVINNIITITMFENSSNK